MKVILFSDGETLGELIKGVDGYPLLIEHVIAFKATPAKVVEAANAELNALLSNVVLTVSRLPDKANKSGITTKYSVALVAFAVYRILVVVFVVVVVFVLTVPFSSQAIPSVPNTLSFSTFAC